MAERKSKCKKKKKILRNMSTDEMNLIHVFSLLKYADRRETKGSEICNHLQTDILIYLLCYCLIYNIQIKDKNFHLYYPKKKLNIIIQAIPSEKLILPICSSIVKHSIINASSQTVEDEF
ncbi:hypothetical protein Avbf_09900 [Armadillidium vulgare]|nr:hypothetical protein Avbf_09900 [Armadillidium vulgare]